MGTLPPHELSCLGEDDSWELFSKKAFSRGVELQEEFIKIGKLIVSKCKGLPLALKTMGGLMSSKHQINEWEAITESNRGGNNEVLSILKLSYIHLSSEMKQCFAFCAVFPKDYEMHKDILIQLWMANNFIHAEESINLVEKGETIFNELVWRSFIQDVNTKIIDEFYFPSYKEIRCKMHDLMHDLAKDITYEYSFAEELIQHKASVNNVRHMHLSRGEIIRLKKSSLCLRTLLAQKSEHTDLKEFKLTSLRAIHCLDPYIINPTHLRYLDLSDSEIVRLPDSICMMYNLQTLRLNYCRNLQVLPEGMQTMRKLTHIYLLGCTSLKGMPPKLSLLHNLCTLTSFILGTGNGFGIEELKGLKQLGNMLELLKNLNELFLHWGRDVNYNPLHDEVISNNEEVLESLAPHVELKTLGLHGYAGLSISRWMKDPKMFHCLRELYVSNCPRCKDLPLVWLSSSLEKLCLSRMNSLTTLCKTVDAEAAGYNNSLQIFPKLKTMWLCELPELERWEENSAGEPNGLVVFPQLESLFIGKCNKIVTLPESPALTFLSYNGEPVEGLDTMSMPLGIFPSLVNLKIGMLVDVVMPVKDHQNQSKRPLDTRRNLDIIGDNGFISMFNSSKLQLGLGDCLELVEQLKISSCSNIVHWPVEEFLCLVRLQSLEISSCYNLEGKGSSSEEFFPLPQLEKLKIGYCERLLEIPKLPASFREMHIIHCRSLVALPLNLGDLSKLRSSL